MLRSTAAAVVALVILTACEVPTPLAPAEPVGEVPRWGEAFETPKDAPASALQPDMGNTGLDPGTQSPGSTGEWGGGDATVGKGVWLAMCSRCHGENGEGGAMPGVGSVPAFNDAAWQNRLTDREIARAIALGRGAMPSFMRELDRDKLSGVIAHIRTLKK